MPPKANKRLPQKGKGGRGWRPGGDKTLRTKQTRRGCRRTDAVSEPSHTHTQPMAQSVVGGQQTVQSHCGVLVHSRHQELLLASQSKQRYHHQRRCQGEKWNGTEFRAQTSITAVVLQRPGPSRSHRNSSTRVETQQLKYYKRLSFLPFLS